MNNEDFENITEEQKHLILKEMKNSYEETINYIGSNDKTMFSWSSNKKLKFYIILVGFQSDKNWKSLVIFAEENSKDELIFINALKETTNYNFERVNMFDGNSKLNQLIDLRILNSDIQPLIYSYFANVYNGDLISLLKKYTKDFSKKEFEGKNNILQSRNDVLFTEKQKLYFINRFDTFKIIDTINDEQLTNEMFECFFAYENGKFYIAAAGLGAVVEHIMDIVIKNYGGKALRKLDKNPTANDYKVSFREDPINMDRKQETRIDIIFKVRNSISHYSSGYSNKALVDIMLDGILNLYNEFYLPSLSYLRSNQ